MSTAVPGVVSTVVLGAIAQHGGALGWAVGAACLVATVLAGLRWLRVAQREHYLPDSASRFALRWWRSTALNRVALLIAVVGLLLGGRWTACAFATAAVVASGPIGLGLRGRTSPLRWTRRLRTLAAVWLALQGAVVVAGILSGFVGVLGAAGALVVPALVDLACAVTAPLENRLSDRYVRRAGDKLRRVRPKVVAITGSFGKTSTKGYVTHLSSGSMSVAASPASYNNKPGLARAVNEVLTDSTEVFVAEMGTYGRGEIAGMCSWIPPDIAVITAIGPVHLERFGSEDEIVLAKSEIVSGAPCCVLMVDDERLSSLAEKMQQSGKKVWRASAEGAEGSVSAEAAGVSAGGGVSAEAGVSADERFDVDVRLLRNGKSFELSVHGTVVARSVELSTSARPQNVACAVAVALELGVPVDEIVKRLASLPVVAHRLEPQSTPKGFVVLDDTYNSNPAGVRVALEALCEAAEPGHRRVVVTPGMVELGVLQAAENMRFARAAAEVATDLVVVGRTNRRALVTGFRGDGGGSGREPVMVPVRDQAVRWVREELGPGDAVLYENDLPDHYP